MLATSNLLSTYAFHSMKVKVLLSDKEFSRINLLLQPLTSCRVGSQVPPAGTDKQETSLSGTWPLKKQSALKTILQSATKSGGNTPGVITVPTGSRDEMWGQSVPLYGQIGSICIFHEALSVVQVKALYLAGPNNLTLFNDETDLQDLPGKMVLHFNARVCFLFIFSFFCN